MPKCSGVLPYFCICSTPALPKIFGADGPFPDGWSSESRMKNVSRGTVLSLKNVYRDPVNIFSNPNARAHSAIPDLTALAARNKALLPVEQLLLTFTTGMPVMPTV